jgi:anti-sigma B factor antagonist
MDLFAEQNGDVTIIRVDARRIDAAVAIQFKDEMRIATAEGIGRVVLDLGKVDFLDSSGLGALVAAMKQLGKERPLELAALSPTVAKVLKLTCMDRVFPIHDSVEAALAQVNAA